MEIKPEINYLDFEKLDLRVAEIKNAEDISGADKLYKLSLDLGELGERIVCAGIKAHYSKEDLIGKKVILLSNLQPRKLKGIESQGMILASTDSETGKVSLLVPDENATNGSEIH